MYLNFLYVVLKSLIFFVLVIFLLLNYVEDEEEFVNIFSGISAVLKEPKPPVADKKKICSKCAYYEFCFV